MDEYKINVQNESAFLYINDQLEIKTEKKNHTKQNKKPCIVPKKKYSRKFQDLGKKIL